MILRRDLYRSWGYVLGVANVIFIMVLAFFKKLTNIEKGKAGEGDYSNRFRGIPYLELSEDGSDLKCDSCMRCSSNCPAKCIHIASATPKKGSSKLHPISFEIELLRCTFCGLCQEVCPIDAIKLGPVHEMAGLVEHEWMLDHHHLTSNRWAEEERSW